jgi:hypothetical protein
MSTLHLLVRYGILGITETLLTHFQLLCNPLIRDANGETAADLLGRHMQRFSIQTPHAKKILDDMRRRELRMFESIIATQIPKISKDCNLGCIDAVTLALVFSFL